MTSSLPPVAGVIGWPIAHSKSPIIHRFWLEKLKLDGDYSRFPVPPERLGAALRALPALGLRGVNVTVPHKQAVIEHLDRVDPIAARLGAVNTVVVEDGALVGYNSDAPGFLEPLQPLLGRAWLFKMARIIGTGGAARAIAHALHDAGFLIVIIGRDLDKARALHHEFGADDNLIGTVDSFRRPLDFEWTDRSGVLDLVVNATTLGMIGEPPLDLHLSNVPPGAIVYDIVYSPLETPLLRDARAAGHRVIDGLSMLIGQAAVAFEKFYGVAPPRDHDAELRARLTR